MNIYRATLVPHLLRLFVIAWCIGVAPAALAADPPVEDTETPGAAARRFLQLASTKPAEAMAMLVTEERNLPPKEFAEIVRKRWGHDSEFDSPMFGEVAGELTHGDWALVVVRRSAKVQESSLEKSKQKITRQFESGFPEAERPKAAEFIYWEGSTFHDVATVYLQRADEGEPWQVLIKGPDRLPMPAFITDMQHQWGCFLNRWRNIDTIYWDDATRERAQKEERRRRAQERREQRKKRE